MHSSLAKVAKFVELYDSKTKSLAQCKQFLPVMCWWSGKQAYQENILEPIKSYLVSFPIRLFSSRLSNGRPSFKQT